MVCYFRRIKYIKYKFSKFISKWINRWYSFLSMANAGPSQTICVSIGTTTMAANTPTVGTGIWSVLVGGSSVNNFFSPTTGVTGLTVGNHILQWTISNGVCASSTSTMSIQVDDVPTIANAGTSQTICVSTGSTTISGSTPLVGTGVWNIVSGSGTITSPTSATTTVTGMGAGTTILQWTISNGVCSSSTSTMSIQVDDVPTIATASPNQTICASTSTISANTPVIGLGNWSVVSGGGTI